jgi:RHS repeat-associated protein
VLVKSGIGGALLIMRLPGQYFDIETGLHYNYYRTYDPATGRYIESDPIGLEGGINTYGYALGQPVRYTDRRGLNVAVEAGVAALVFCRIYPSLCVAGAVAVCRLMGGCKIQDNYCPVTQNGSGGDTASEGAKDGEVKKPTPEAPYTNNPDNTDFDRINGGKGAKQNQRMVRFGSVIHQIMVAERGMGLSGSGGQIKGRGKKVRSQTVSGLMGELENE